MGSTNTREVDLEIMLWDRRTKREVDLEIMNLPLEGAATMQVELPIQKTLKKVIHELCQISTIDRTLAQTGFKRSTQKRQNKLQTV